MIRDHAVLIGLSPEGKCVYSAAIPLHEYWDGTHVWDNAKGVKKLRLAQLKGFLFDGTGALLQQFESNFSLKTGRYQKGWARHSDGTYN